MVYSLKHGIYAHPFELVASVNTFLAVYVAFKLLVFEPETLTHLTSGILSLPLWILWVWVVMGFLGSVCVFVGLTMSIFSPRGREIEEVGLWLMGSMWLSAAVARMALDLGSWEEYLRFWTLGFACVCRLLMIHNYQGLMRRDVRNTGEVKVT